MRLCALAVGKREGEAGRMGEELANWRSDRGGTVAPIPGMLACSLAGRRHSTCFFDGSAPDCARLGVDAPDCASRRAVVVAFLTSYAYVGRRRGSWASMRQIAPAVAPSSSSAGLRHRASPARTAAASEKRVFERVLVAMPSALCPLCPLPSATVPASCLLPPWPLHRPEATG